MGSGDVVPVECGKVDSEFFVFNDKIFGVSPGGRYGGEPGIVNVL